jgi:DtxR family transcriptional regulator, Mn-dependent transcriptional regulator
MSDSTGPPMTDEILEDCLQALYRLTRDGKAVSTAQAAESARLTLPVFLAALRELLNRELATETRDGLRLTAEGRRLGAGVVRRHRLSERLLTDILGIPWERAHEEAMRFEHTLRPEAEARLDRLLNHPETCPHGAPIPDASDSAGAPPTCTLDKIPAGGRVRIQQIGEEETEFLRYLASLGLLPQAEVRVEEVAPFGGPLLLQVGTARYALGRDVAAKILVSEDGAAPRSGGRRRKAEPA